jgi:hypothetical protein
MIYTERDVLERVAAERDRRSFFEVQNETFAANAHSEARAPCSPPDFLAIFRPLWLRSTS